MRNKQQLDGMFTRSEVPHGVSARRITVPEGEHNEGGFVDEDEALPLQPLPDDAWDEFLNPNDFYDESDYLYGGAHFPPTIER